MHSAPPAGASHGHVEEGDTDWPANFAQVIPDKSPVSGCGQRLDLIKEPFAFHPYV